jgi:hypothetical protein
MQGKPSNYFDNDVGQRGQQQPELIEPPFVAGYSICEQIGLLLLDTIFHLTSGVLETIVKVLWFAIEIGDNVTGIGAFIRVFSLGNYASFDFP